VDEQFADTGSTAIIACEGDEPPAIGCLIAAVGIGLANKVRALRPLREAPRSRFECGRALSEQPL
jgi:hypothetical protein